MTEHEQRVLNMIRAAFAGVVLGEGVGLRQGQGLDDYAGAQTLASLRAQDEKHDWSTILVDDLDRCYSSLSFFDPDGMRFHLPAYLVAGAASRFDTLSPAQREAVREFLLLRLSDPHQEFVHPMIEAALHDYWTARTES